VKPSLRQEDNGRKIVFHCQLEAQPKPEISWFRGTTKLEETDRVKFSVTPKGNKYDITLEISNVSDGDGGAYKVTAKNKLGDAAANVNVNFGSK
jgi:hypothetical protein